MLKQLQAKVWSNKEAALLSAGILLLLYIISFAYWYPVYESNDDMSFQLFATGFYTGQPEPFLRFTNILFGYLLVGLYSISEQLNWYTLCILAAQFIAFWSILYFSIKGRKGVLPFLFVTTLFVMPAWYVVLSINFTTTAALASLAAFIVLSCAASRKAYAWALLIYSIGIIIRWESVVMTHLLLGPLFLVRFGFRKSFQQFWPVATVAVVFIFLNMLSVSDQWQEVAKLGEGKALVDFPVSRELANLSEEQLKKAGWSRNDVDMFRNFFFEDTSVMTTEHIQKLRSQLTPPGLNPLGQWRQLLRNTIHWFGLLPPLAYLLLAVGFVLCLRMQWKESLLLGILFVAVTVLFAWTYLPRIRGMVTIELTVLASMLWIISQTAYPSKKPWLLVMGIIAGTGLFISETQKHLPNAKALRQMAESRFNYVKENPEYNYVVFTTAMRFEGLNPLKQYWTTANHDMRFIWAANLGGTPYQAAALRRLQTPDVFTLLSDSSKGRLLSRYEFEPEMLRKYFEERKNESYTFKAIKPQDEFYVWKFEKETIEMPTEN